MIPKLFAPTKQLWPQVYNKAKKLPVHRSSKVPFKYKRNAITGERHGAKRIASGFDEVTKRIRSIYTDAGFSKHVIENKILSRILTERKMSFWYRRRFFVVIYSSKNEKYRAYFVNNLVSFTSGKVKLNVVWNARKIQSLFPLKDKVRHLDCVIHKGICSCGEKLRRWNN